MILSTIRFNNETWYRNNNYRREKNYGCIYCVPMKISEQIMIDTILFVVEMNNEMNQIEGIGLIKNRLECCQHIVHISDGNYNRYIYKGEHHLSRAFIEKENSKLVYILEQILFKGKTHLKRGNGFMRITPKLLELAKKMGKTGQSGQAVSPPLDIDILKEVKALFVKQIQMNKERENKERIKE